MAASTTADASKKKSATQLSREQHKALLNHHIGLLSAAKKNVEETKAPYDEAKDEFTSRINDAKADLGKRYTRKRLSGLIEDRTSRLRDLLREEEERFQDRVDLGLPVYGEQQSLAFGDAKATDTERDLLQWEGEGYIRGRRGDLRELQDGDPPQFHQEIIRGFRRGQDETQAQYLAAQEIIQRRGEPDADAEPANLNAEDQDEEGALDDAADQLKRSGFMNTGAGDEQADEPASLDTGDGQESLPQTDGFEATDDELAAQTQRQAVRDAREGLTSGEADDATATPKAA